MDGRSIRTASMLALLAGAAGCSTAMAPRSLPASQGGAPMGQRAAASAAPVFAGFWESWSDWDKATPYHSLGEIPAAVNDVDVAFSTADSNAISDPQNTYSLKPGIATIHKHGGRVLLSIGGASSSFAITDVATFETNLKAYTAAHKGYYDGFDFDDETGASNTATLLTQLATATRTAFPGSTISFDAFMDGTDPANPFEAGVLQNAPSALSYVNVMDYDQYGYKPSNYPNCTWHQGAADDCYLDVLANFAAVKMPGGGTFPTSQIVMGLMIGPADDGAVITPKEAAAYAAWVRAHGYGGVMIWDVDRDGPKTTGHPKGAYIKAISQAL
jgi:chitinase